MTRICKSALLTLLFLARIVEASLARTPQPAESPSPGPTLSPRELFHRTFTRLEKYPIPPYVLIVSLWQVRPSINPHNLELDFAWRYAIRDSDGRENASTWILNVGGFLPMASVVKESIGGFATILIPRRAVEASMPPGDSYLKTIAVVEATKADYRMDLIGEEAIDNHTTDRLRLAPLRNLPKYNLRDLWIDAQTFDLRRATFVFWGDDRLRNGATITADFGPAQRYWIVLRSAWSNAKINFEETTIRVLTPSALPAWLFDQSVYDQHRNAGERDPLYEILNATPSPSPTPSA
ncbi:MAG: hypothetical protein WCC84_09295 [Candidatus Cybelea sp.]